MTAQLMIVGLTGHTGSGKDSCAIALANHGFRSIAFADALRMEIEQAWRLDHRVLSDRSTKEVALPALAIGMCGDPLFLHWAVYHGHSLHEPRSPRWIMQRWGTDFRRSQRPDYWTRIVEQWAWRRIGLGSARLVITDVRMPNEADLVRSLDGKIVRVHRPDLPAAMATDTAAHESEHHTALHADAVICNDGSLAALAEETYRVMRDLFGHQEALA